MKIPVEIIAIIGMFEKEFSKPIYEHVKVLIVGAILATGKRTITSILRVTGKAQETNFTNYHRVLNRAKYSSLKLAKILLIMIVEAFGGDEPLVFGIDETIERRKGGKIKARAIYRDPVRSSQSHFVKASGLRWMTVMMMAKIPWAAKVWAMPFFTALVPSEGYYKNKKREHKKLTDWARQMILQVKRWLPYKEVIFVADSSYSALELLDSVRHQVTMITRLRLDAALYEPLEKTLTKAKGRPRLKGKRLPNLTEVLVSDKTIWQSITILDWYGQAEKEIEITSATCVWYHKSMAVVPMRWVLIRDPKGRFAPQALLSTNLELEPTDIVKYFVMRWRMEVTFEESRAHLGVETQRQWSDFSISRSTPFLFALFSIVTLIANSLLKGNSFPTRSSSWYKKTYPTFSDTIALVRFHLWPCFNFSMSLQNDDILKIPRSLFNRFIDTLCFAA